jgi:hypothetical protein
LEKVKKIHIHDMQPVLMIAKYPRATIRFCIMFKPLIYFFFIGIVGAFSSQLSNFVNEDYPFQFTLGDIVSSSMIFSVIVFVFSTLISAALMQFFGKTLGGKGNFKQMFRALCLTYIPFIWILPALLFWMQLSPESYFVIPGIELTIGDQLMTYAGPILIVSASIWSLFLIVKAIQEVQRLSLLRSIVSFLLLVVVFASFSIILFMTTGVRLI